MSIPSRLQPLVDQWKSTLSLGDGERQEALSTPDSYRSTFEHTVRTDNSEMDLSSLPGVVVTARRGGSWTERYEGDSQKGLREALLPGGIVVITTFSPEAIDHFWLKPTPQGNEALHDHHDLVTGQSWNQQISNYVVTAG